MPRTGTRLARRPGHLTTAHDVKMEMKDRLASARPIVDHHAIVLETRIGGHPGSDPQKVAQECFVLGTGVRQGLDRLARDYQEVGRSSRIGVMEGQRPLVLVDELGRGLAPGNLSKDRIGPQ